MLLEVVLGDFTELELEATIGDISQPSSLRDQVFGGRRYFCLHVFCVQFAYIRAAGSPFAKKPTSSGGLSIFSRLALTSFSRPSATVAAETTLQVAGGGSWRSLAVAVGILSVMLAVEGRGRRGEERRGEAVLWWRGRVLRGGVVVLGVHRTAVVPAVANTAGAE